MLCLEGNGVYIQKNVKDLHVTALTYKMIINEKQHDWPQYWIVVELIY